MPQACDPIPCPDCVYWVARTCFVSLTPPVPGDACPYFTEATAYSGLAAAGPDEPDLNALFKPGSAAPR